MKPFSATDAAFTGFRFVRENPRVVAIWVAIYLVFSLAGAAVMVVLGGPALTELIAADPTAAQDLGASVARLRALAPFYLASLAASAVFYPTLYATMNRAHLNPQDRAQAYVRFGADELRQFLLFLLWLAVSIGAYIGVVVAGSLLAAGVAVAAGKTAGNVAVLFVLAAVMSGVIYGWTRLSLASPMTFDRGRVDLFGSWRLTRGRFWPISATYGLVVLLTLLVVLLVMVITVAVAAVFGGLQGIQQLVRPDLTSLATYFTPARLAAAFVWAIATAMLSPVWLMPRAEIYARLSDQTEI